MLFYVLVMVLKLYGCALSIYFGLFSAFVLLECLCGIIDVLSVFWFLG